MLSGSCHCGAITLTVASKPTYLNECHCSICYKYGTRWAYYHPNDVTISARSGDLTDAVDRYQCNSKSQDFVRCRHCGCVTHWARHEEDAERMGVNMRLVPEGEVKGVEIRQGTGPE